MTAASWATLKDGRVVETALDTNLHPWRTAYLRVPGQFTLDASLFKAFRITERTSIRLNLDALKREHMASGSRHLALRVAPGGANAARRTSDKLGAHYNRACHLVQE
jgi:hypothetical protein